MDRKAQTLHGAFWRFSLQAAAVSVLLGLTGTVAIALFCAHFVRYDPARVELLRTGPAARVLLFAFLSDEVAVARAFGSERAIKGYVAYRANQRIEAPPSWSLVRSHERNVKPHSNGWALIAITEDARGWPWRAFMTYAGPTLPSGGPGEATTLHGGFVLGDDYHDQLLGFGPSNSIIPFMPIWRGIAADTALFTFVMLVAAISARALVILRRTRGDRCWRCSYPRPAATVRCPECGAVLHSGPSTLV